MLQYKDNTKYIYIHTYMHTYIHTYMYTVYIYTHIYVCLYIFIHTYDWRKLVITGATASCSFTSWCPCFVNHTFPASPAIHPMWSPRALSFHGVFFAPDGCKLCNEHEDWVPVFVNWCFFHELKHTLNLKATHVRRKTTPDHSQGAIFQTEMKTKAT